MRRTGEAATTARDLGLPQDAESGNSVLGTLRGVEAGKLARAIMDDIADPETWRAWSTRRGRMHRNPKAGASRPPGEG